MKERYYVAVETGVIHKKPFDDQVNYYEIEATTREHNELQAIFTKLRELEYEFTPILLKPLKESEGIERREEQQQIMTNLFTMLYTLGTAETKGKLASLHILDELHTT
ncbi:hypothetical protein [Metabacillus iocasae]|uniref:Uncharacterized protein n=1 Tax=Priestia iocasae TaxID=2291674 RepID=A0ABS2QZ81_9BACI|nr:hypothetical protein [Metabacillus iocasae]MBM7704302.1 hypothetical protein [Metabacillus iocasae]